MTSERMMRAPQLDGAVRSVTKLGFIFTSSQSPVKLTGFVYHDQRPHKTQPGRVLESATPGGGDGGLRPRRC